MATVLHAVPSCLKAIAVIGVERQWREGKAAVAAESKVEGVDTVLEPLNTIN